MSGLDINTPAGQESLAQERALIAAVEAAYPHLRCVETHKGKAAKVDGVLVSRRSSAVVGVYESKCRDLDMAQLKRYGDEWLLTYDKLCDGSALSRALCVPFIGFVYLLREPIVLAIRLTDDAGHLLPHIRLERTKTQRTINGGSIVRTNAYIDMSGAHPLSLPCEGDAAP